MNKIRSLVFSLTLALAAHSAMAVDMNRKNGNKRAARFGEVISVNETDVRILRRAAEILRNPAAWNKQDNRECPASAKKFSLYCALWKASEEVNGEFDHRLGALEELRRTVEQASRGKAYEHRLMDFNNDPATKLEDIHRALEKTAQRISARLQSKPK